jgi:nitroimidazol reductase NimA-like FMN-containing flavoprotein (pyridoxamine 5'-phosphate oxidase superfamily)
MTMPVTTVDERYSDPGATAASWAETCAVLESAELSWLTTVRADGRPHVTPLVAVWLDGAACFCTGIEEQKYRNLTVNPHVVLTTGCSRWDEGLDVMVEGDAVRVTDPAALERLAAAWTAKWDGSWVYHVRDGGFTHTSESETADVHVFAVTPAQVLAFRKGAFSQTSHRF